MERMLKIKDLIKYLQEEDPESYVALAGDTEGNSYSIMRLEGCMMPEAYLLPGLGGQEDNKFEDELTEQEKKKYVKVVIYYSVQTKQMTFIPRSARKSV